MGLRTEKKSVWKLLPMIGFVSLTLWLLLYFDPIFEQCNFLLLLLLPLAWRIVNYNLRTFQSDYRVLTPKNVMLFVWVNKLVIVPLELIFIDSRVALLEADGRPIHEEIIIILVSFFSFVLGWQRYLLKRPKRLFTSFVFTKQWAIIFLIIAMLSLIYLHGSLINYWKGAIFTYVTREILEEVGGSALGYFANVGQRFWSFGVLVAWYWWKQKIGIRHWYWHIPWLMLCIMGTLSSNRSNMIYPFLMLMSIMAESWRLRHKEWLFVIVIGLVFLSLFFGYLRVQPDLDSEQVGELFDSYKSNDDYVWYAHQLYFGTPYQITPLLYIENQVTTIAASLLDPVPIFGKAFREESGPYIYNLAIYNSTISQDKVIPVAGELYYNGGFMLLALGYILFGYLYRWLDLTFKNHVVINPVLAASFFYLALLFNATLLLSLSVLVQYLLYNAAPALLIITINWWQMRKGS